MPAASTNIKHNIYPSELFRDPEALHPARHLANEEDPDHCSNPTRLTIRLTPRRPGLANNKEVPEHRSNPVRLTVRLPPRRLCSLCSRVHAVIDLRHQTQPTRCLSCQAWERCSCCLRLKKRKHFQSSTTQDVLMNYSRVAKAVVIRTWIMFGSTVKLLMHSDCVGAQTVHTA